MADPGPKDQAPGADELPDLRGSYTVGDYINLDLTVEHTMHLLEARVVFGLEADESIELVISGLLQPEDQGSRKMRSVMLASRRVSLEDVPGTYVLLRLEVEAASTRVLKREWDVRRPAFDIVAEPNEWNFTLNLDQHDRGPLYPTDDEQDWP